MVYVIKVAVIIIWVVRGVSKEMKRLITIPKLAFFKTTQVPIYHRRIANCRKYINCCTPENT